MNNLVFYVLYDIVFKSGEKRAYQTLHTSADLSVSSQELMYMLEEQIAESNNWSFPVDLCFNEDTYTFESDSRIMLKTDDISQVKITCKELTLKDITGKYKVV